MIMMVLILLCTLNINYFNLFWHAYIQQTFKYAFSYSILPALQIYTL